MASSEVTGMRVSCADGEWLQRAGDDVLAGYKVLAVMKSY